MTRVLIVEDSSTTRKLLVELLRSESGFEVVGEAQDGEEAVEMTRRLRPDVVTMDIRMPRLEGFEATRRIMAETPTPIVIVTASLDARSVETSMNALKAGALSAISTPPGPGSIEFEMQRRQFLDTIRAVAQVNVVASWAARSAHRPPLPAVLAGPGLRVLAMAASTGGPPALATILAELPGDLPVPLLLVQHIAPGFGEGFATWLNTHSSLPVHLAVHGEPIEAGTVYVAPDDQHLGVAEARTIALSSAPPIAGSRPSATHLFETVARVYGRSALGVVLTGMGRDGLAGLRALRAAGGLILAQDEATSVVFGMPGAAVAAGLANDTVPLQKMAGRIRELVEGRA